MIFSLLMAGCSSIERPDSNLCGINAVGLRLHCYNLKKDFNNKGQRLKNAKPLVVQFKTEKEMLDFMNKGFMMDVTSFERTNVFVKEVREYCD